MYFWCLCPPSVVSAPGNNFLPLLPYFSYKAQLKGYMLYVVSHEYWLTSPKKQ